MIAKSLNFVHSYENKDGKEDEYHTHTHLFLIYCEGKFALTGYEENSGLLSLGQRLSVDGP